MVRMATAEQLAIQLKVEGYGKLPRSDSSLRQLVSPNFTIEEEQGQGQNE